MNLCPHLFLVPNASLPVTGHTDKWRPEDISTETSYVVEGPSLSSPYILCFSPYR